MASTPDLVVPGAGILTLRWTYGASGAGGMNVMGVALQAGTTVTQTLANTLDTAIKSALGTSGFGVHVHTSVNLVSVGIRDIRGPHLTEFIGSGASQAGTGTGDPLPRGVAFVVSLKTARSGAAYRGRVYLGGLLETDNDTSSAAAAAVGTTAVAFVNAIGTALSGNGGGLAVVSRPAYAVDVTTTTIIPGGTNEVDTKHHRARAGEVTPVTSVVARNLQWDSQRRRTTAGSVSTLFAPVAAFAEIGGEVVTSGASRAARR